MAVRSAGRGVGGVVFAVDPAELGEFVGKEDGCLPPNVTHLKMRGEDAVGDGARRVSSGPVSRGFHRVRRQRVAD